MPRVRDSRSVLQTRTQRHGARRQREARETRIRRLRMPRRAVARRVHAAIGSENEEKAAAHLHVAHSLVDRQERRSIQPVDRVTTQVLAILRVAPEKDAPTRRQCHRCIALRSQARHAFAVRQWYGDALERGQVRRVRRHA